MNSKQKGALGELLAAKFLKNQGYRVISRNYRRTWGELDLVLQKDEILHFAEVKSVSRSISATKNKFHGLTHEPEENIHAFKLRQIAKMIKTYMAEQGITRETSFQFHVICVYIDIPQHAFWIKWLKNIIL